jgi:hypothetical protein
MNVRNGVAACGQAVGLVYDISSVKELIDSIINGAKEIRQRLLAG